jgi:hypothetical protein
VTKCHLLGRHGLASRAVFQQSDDPSNSTPCTRSVIHSSLSCTMTTPLDRLRLLPSYCGFCTAVDFAPTDHHHPWILRCCDRGRSVTLWHLIPKKQITATFQLHARITSQLSVCSGAFSPILIACAAALHRQRAHAPFTRLILDSARSRARPAESCTCTLPSLLPPFRSNPDFPRPPPSRHDSRGFARDPHRTHESPPIPSYWSTESPTQIRLQQ